MDLIMINDTKFPTKTSKDFMELMDAASKNSKLELAKWLFNYSVFPWNWKFREINIL